MSELSGYTTTLNCIDRNYPFKECLQSLLGFCDEVCVVDGGSTDGTIEEIRRLADRDGRIRLAVEPVDFANPRWAIQMDGFLKAKARAMCTKPFCWQTDNDEVVAPWDYGRIREIPRVFEGVFKTYSIVLLPMIEFWGGFDRIRADFFTWKARVSVNDPRITHGIPGRLATCDDAGREYPIPFESDSCNYIYRDTRESVKAVVPVKDVDYNLPPDQYDVFFHECIDALPSIYHVSWLDLQRKIEHYRSFWPQFHASMYNLPEEDTAERNVMFSKPWAEVTERDVAEKVEELRQLGPRSFHHKLNPFERGATVPFRGKVPPALLLWEREIRDRQSTMQCRPDEAPLGHR